MREYSSGRQDEIRTGRKMKLLIKHEACSINTGGEPYLLLCTSRDLQCCTSRMEQNVHSGPYLAAFVKKFKSFEGNQIILRLSRALKIYFSISRVSRTWAHPGHLICKEHSVRYLVHSDLVSVCHSLFSLHLLYN